MNERHVKLCASVLQHAVWADHTQDRRPSEVKETLKFFFTDDEIASAIADISGKPRPAQETPAVRTFTAAGPEQGMSTMCECGQTFAKHIAQDRNGNSSVCP